MRTQWRYYNAKLTCAGVGCWVQGAECWVPFGVPGAGFWAECWVRSSWAECRVPRSWDTTEVLTFAFLLRIVGAMLPLTKRQREILDYLNEFITQHGYAPSLEEIGRRFGLSSLATVHKHLTNLQEKGFIKRAWNRSRSVEMVPTRTGGRAVQLPLLGYVAAGLPIEAVASSETISVPEDLVGKRDTYVLRVRGDSMIDEQIRDGDFVVVEDRKSADNGEMVIALLRGSPRTRRT